MHGSINAYYPLISIARASKPWLNQTLAIIPPLARFTRELSGHPEVAQVLAANPFERSVLFDKL